MAGIVVPEAFVPLWQDAGYEHYAFFGGRGGSKSHSIGEAIVALSCRKEERVVCGREYQNSIRDSVKELLEKKIHKMGMAAYFTSTERELVNVSTGSRYSFIGMNRNPESAKSLEGCTLFWGEEAQTFVERSVEIIIPTIRAEGSRMVWSWNPRFREDSVDELFRGAIPPEKSYIKHVSWRDNPWFYQTRMPSERRRLKLAKPKRYPHVWEGAYDENPDIAIYTDWSVGRPNVDLGRYQPRFGMDFGYSNDPYAITKSYLIPELNTVYIAQEAFGNQVPNRHLPDLMDKITEIRDYYVVGDSSRPELIEYLNSCGYPVQGSRKGAGSVKNGIGWLQGYHLLVDPDCVNVQKELRMYRWKTDPTGTIILPVPAEGWDHGMDALRYAHEDDSVTAFGTDDGVDYI